MVYIILYGRVVLQGTGNSTESSQGFTIGASVGEESFFDQAYQERMENCYASSDTCVLEISQKTFNGLKNEVKANFLDPKDYNMLNQILKRQFCVKKKIRLNMMTPSDTIRVSKDNDT